MSDAHNNSETPFLKTPLYEAHMALGARMVPFTGYAMPVQYPMGVLGEHLHTRTHAGLFDVSHMGQAELTGVNYESLARALEALMPADILGLSIGQQRYSQLLNKDGGILDDLMLTRLPDENGKGRIYMVVNAGCKVQDFAHLKAHLPATITLTERPDLALLALQGPEARKVLARFADVSTLTFMSGGAYTLNAGKKSISAHISCSGYTGEDGYEISLAEADATEFWNLLLQEPEVKPIGLGARDSLRLEAGLCLYGHDIDESTSPVEAGLLWSIQKRRRIEGGFPGAKRIQTEIESGAKRKLVFLAPEGRQPIREGVEIAAGGAIIGKVTSGGFGPSLNGPLAIGYVDVAHAKIGTKLSFLVRGKEIPCAVIKGPFSPHRYFKA